MSTAPPVEHARAVLGAEPGTIFYTRHGAPVVVIGREYHYTWEIARNSSLNGRGYRPDCMAVARAFSGTREFPTWSPDVVWFGDLFTHEQVEAMFEKQVAEAWERAVEGLAESLRAGERLVRFRKGLIW